MTAGLGLGAARISNPEDLIPIRDRDYKIGSPDLAANPGSAKGEFCNSGRVLV